MLKTTITIIVSCYSLGIWVLLCVGVSLASVTIWLPRNRFRQKYGPPENLSKNHPVFLASRENKCEMVRTFFGTLMTSKVLGKFLPVCSHISLSFLGMCFSRRHRGFEHDGRISNIAIKYPQHSIRQTIMNMSIILTIIIVIIIMITNKPQEGTSQHHKMWQSNLTSQSQWNFRLGVGHQNRGWIRWSC